MQEQATALKQHLKAEGRQIRWLAKKTKIKYPRLYAIVRGEIEAKISEGYLIADVLDLPITTLFPREGVAS